MTNTVFRATTLGLGLFAATFAGTAIAETVTLATPDRSIEVEGDLIGFNGTDYTILSSVGVLTVAASSVSCNGAACPAIKDDLPRLSLAGLQANDARIEIAD